MSESSKRHLARKSTRTSRSRTSGGGGFFGFLGSLKKFEKVLRGRLVQETQS